MYKFWPGYPDPGLDVQLLAQMLRSYPECVDLGLDFQILAWMPRSWPGRWDPSPDAQILAWIPRSWPGCSDPGPDVQILAWMFRSWPNICRIMIGKLTETSFMTFVLGFFLVVSLLPYWHKRWPRMDPWIYLLNYFCSKEATLFVSLCWSELRTLCRTFSWCLTGTLSGLSFLSLLGSSLGAWLALAEPSNI